jgi:hypothetical protein
LSGIAAISPMTVVKEMMTNESKQPPNSTSSDETENAGASDKIFALGRQLVEELGLDDSVDTLGRWMAHYIAELITKVEHASGDDKIAMRRECFAAILTLWKHRAELPNGKRPFEDIEPIMRAIESLDPESFMPRYYRGARPPMGETAETPDQQKWLRLVDGLDYSARALIGYCLAEAAEAALDKSKAWVQHAMAIDDGAPELVIRFVSSAHDVNKAQDPNEEVRLLLQDRIKRLRGFLHIADSLASTLEDRLEALPPVEDVPEEGERLVMFAPPTLPDEMP